jgi:hypothetical protein
MNNQGIAGIQDLSCCGLSVIAGMGVYLGLANQLGISKLPALLGATLLTVVLLFLYRLLLTKTKPQAGPALLILQLLAAAIIISLNMSGVIRLWAAFELSRTPSLVYALLASSLLALVAWRGEKAVLRAGPLVCLLLIVAIIFDTVFIAPKINPAYLWQYPLKPASDILAGGAEITVALLAPSMLFLLCFFLHLSKGGVQAVFPWQGLAKGLIFPLAYLIIELLRELMVFGDLIALDQYPILRTLKAVYFGVGVSRLEFLEIIALCSAILTGIMLEFTVMLQLTQRLLGGAGSKNGVKNSGNNTSSGNITSDDNGGSSSKASGKSGGSNRGKQFLLAGQIALILLGSTLFNIFSHGLVWLVAEAAAILLLLICPLLNLAKKKPAAGK